ncbi:MAG: gamma-glutamylcyclotransferase [Novosphingobium sp.]|nr:gamma-glutamylcyclotransferase [Novosphingobium sp.]
MRFFFYGTLQHGNTNPVARAVHARLAQLGEATMRGRLYAVREASGWYPVLVPGQGTVHGALYETRPDFTQADLAMLDGWEDFDPRRPGRSLYVRRLLPVDAQPGRDEAAHAYVYNRTLPRSARRIASGNFNCWLTHTGLPAFGSRRVVPAERNGIPLPFRHTRSNGARFNDTNSSDQPG